MTELKRAGQTGSLGHIDTTQLGFQEQVNALTDTVRQLAGGPQSVGGLDVPDPLNSPYTLYVDSNIGSDTFVTGDYVGIDDGTYEAKMRRISLQRLECGYTPARPFRSLSRAVIEAGIITSRDYLTLNPAPCGDLVSIVLSAGETTVLNDAGTSTTPVWTNGQDPTDAELIAFNPQATGGLILPRGCSLISLDLRKTILRPNFVPTPEAEAADYSNRRSIFKTTGGGYYYGFTVMDKVGATTSAHLLDAFQYTSEAELDEFYGKIRASFSGVAGIDDSFAVPRITEYQIVGPLPAAPTEAVDTVMGASPYIYNVSLRSTFGMCGGFFDGSRNSGFSSCVIAQFTSVSLQKDMTCWEIYSGGTWGAVNNYNDYINASPNDLRMKLDRRNFHIRAINDAIIQNVSVFSIGQGVQTWVESGASVTTTNSNSNFGGVSALGEGYRDTASANDTGWSIIRLRVATDLTEKSNNVRKTFLGQIDASTGNAATAIVLEEDLTEGVYDPNTPRALEALGYTLRPGSYIWVQNDLGKDFRAQLADPAWDRAVPNVINVTGAFDNQDGETPGQQITPGVNLPDLAGQNIFIRRLTDVRNTNERRYAVLGLNLGGTNRTPQRDYILQTNPAAAAITGEIPYDESICCAVGSAIKNGPGGSNGLIELRRLNGDSTWTSNAYYRAGDTVRYANKHWNCVQTNSDTSFQNNKWVESYVHMASDFNAEDYFKNAQPAILFNNDTSGDADSTTCGYDLATVWANDPEIQAQYRSATDYRGLYSFLRSLGFSGANAHTILLPTTEALRDRDNTAALDGISNPSGVANSWAAWSIEFRAPSAIRLFGHAYEYAGRASYSKGLPRYQQNLTAANKFTYYMTSSVGRVYGSGFNEEGFLVTPAGIQDLTTGEEVGINEIGAEKSVDEIQFPTFFESLTVNELTVGGAVVTGMAETLKPGFVELAGLSRLANPTAAISDAEIDANPDAVTPEGLAYWQNSQRLVKSLPSGVPYALLHVCSASGTPLTGNNSIPYGQETNSALEWSASGNAFHDTIFTSLTEAVEKASQLFLPTGSTIVISVHDDLGVIEQGPIQLVNGFTRFDVVGARGATSPTVRMKWGTTANACARIPQYSSVESFSAGAVFADLTLELDNNNQNDVVATFNGGYGVGGRDTVVNWSNVGDYCCAATCSYGGDIIFQFYNTDSNTFYLTNNVVSTSSANVRFNLTGSDTDDSGLTGHGCNLIVDLRTTNTQGGLRFVNGTAISPKLSLLDLGKRGGVKCGGRVVPQLKYDFSNDNWDLSELIGINFAHNQNYQGKAFRAEQIASGATASSTYSINATSLATVVPVVLKNGCCCDVTQDNATAPLESGFLSILGELEKDPGITGLLLTAENLKNSFIYNSTTSARNTP